MFKIFKFRLDLNSHTINQDGLHNSLCTVTHIKFSTENIQLKYTHKNKVASMVHLDSADVLDVSSVFYGSQQEGDG